MVAPWLIMSVAIRAVMVIANGVAPPIRMPAYPAMKTSQPDGIADYPDVAGPQVVILVANDADIFVTVPNVIIGNIYWSRRGCHDHRGWSRDDEGLEENPAIGFDYTTGEERDSSSRHHEDGQRYIFIFHS